MSELWGKLKKTQNILGLILLGMLLIPFGLHFAALWDHIGAVYALLAGQGLLMALAVKIG